MLHAKATSSDSRNRPKIARKQPPWAEPLGAMRADHGQSTVAATSRALASPRTPQPRYHAKGFAEMRQRMSGLLMDSKKRSRNVLQKGEQSVSEREALTARDKKATLRPHRAG